jgi:hypothetical protein
MGGMLLVPVGLIGCLKLENLKDILSTVEEK